MYTVNSTIVGISPLMQHRYPIPNDVLKPKGGKRVSGSIDYSQEWREYLYVVGDSQIYQPSSHIEGCMLKAASQFKVTGKRGKTYKDMFAANVIISPDKILHNVTVPETLDDDADKQLYLDVRPVIINRARVIRLRPTFKPGWKLEFEIQVIDDQLPAEILSDVLTLAGKTVGIGDFRPRFGRFMIEKFEVIK